MVRGGYVVVVVELLYGGCYGVGLVCVLVLVLLGIWCVFETVSCVLVGLMHFFLDWVVAKAKGWCIVGITTQ